MAAAAENPPKKSAAASSSDRAPLTAFMKELTEEHETQGASIDDKIAHMKAERDRIKQERIHMRMVLRNATKKRQRLKKKAKELSNNDLIEVFNFRLKQKEKKSGQGTR